MPDKKNKYHNFQRVEKIICKTGNIDIYQFLNNSIDFFYNELDRFCEQNSNYDFGDWFSESGFLSMFINGMIRNDRNNDISAVQEYCIKKHIHGGTGRCDGLIAFKKDAILIEAKRYGYVKPVDANHFDIERWINWDENEIRNQLKNYLLSEKKFFLEENRYNTCYLMTIMFKIIKEDQEGHISNALTNLNPLNDNNLKRTWFYSVGFLNGNNNSISNGIEVYGTISKYVA